MNSMVLLIVILISGWIPPAIGLVITFWLAKRTIEEARRIRGDALTRSNLALRQMMAVAEQVRGEVSLEAARTRKDSEAHIAQLEARLGGIVGGVKVDIPPETIEALQSALKGTLMHALDGKLGAYVKGMEKDLNMNIGDIMQEAEKLGVNGQTSMGEIIKTKLVNSLIKRIDNFDL